MSGELRTYDPDQITISWSLTVGGTVDLSSGLIDGPGAIVETQDGPLWTRVSDRKGNAVRNRSGKKGGVVTCTYVAEAAIHDQLSVIVALDAALGNQTGTIVVKDLNGTTVLTYFGAFIEADPPADYGDTAANRVYVFGYAERVAFLGGAEAL